MFEEGLGKEKLNEVMNCRHLVTIGSKQKIEEVLADIKLCDSTEDYQWCNGDN